MNVKMFSLLSCVIVAVMVASVVYGVFTYQFVYVSSPVFVNDAGDIPHFSGEYTTPLSSGTYTIMGNTVDVSHAGRNYYQPLSSQNPLEVIRDIVTRSRL